MRIRSRSRRQSQGRSCAPWLRARLRASGRRLWLRASGQSVAARLRPPAPLKSHMKARRSRMTSRTSVRFRRGMPSFRAQRSDLGRTKVRAPAPWPPTWLLSSSPRVRAFANEEGPGLEQAVGFGLVRDNPRSDRTAGCRGVTVMRRFSSPQAQLVRVGLCVPFGACLVKMHESQASCRVPGTERD